MKDDDIEKELKMRALPTYRLVKDPVTGIEVWEEDKAAVSFSYDTKELEQWVKLGGIPHDLVKFALKEHEEALKKNPRFKRVSRTN